MKSMFKFLICFFVIASAVFAQVEKPVVYPVVIIGGGVAGLTSGIYLSRAEIKPLIIEGKKASQLTQAVSVENWPGEEKISGFELIEKIKKQALRNGCEILSQEVVKVDFSKKPYELFIQNSQKPGKIEKILTNSCIIATGLYSNRLDLEEEKTYWGRGISSCVLCDGSLYKDKEVAVVGGSDTALSEALYLSNIASKVYVVLKRDDFRAGCDQKNKELLLNKDNVEILYNYAITMIKGNGQEIQSLELRGTKHNSIKNIAVDGLFLAIGSSPNSDIFKGQIDLDAKGFIELKEGFKTSKDGIYAIGDVAVSLQNKQAIIAAAQGAQAAIEVQKHLAFQNIAKPEFSPKGNKIIEITSMEQFEKEVSQSSVPIFIDFYATWCSPCKNLSPFLDAKANDLAGMVKILKVDVNNQTKLAQRYNIRAMPTLIEVDKDFNCLSRKIGSDEIVTFINDFSKKN